MASLIILLYLTQAGSNANSIDKVGVGIGDWSGVWGVGDGQCRGGGGGRGGGVGDEEWGDGGGGWVVGVVDGWWGLVAAIVSSA